MCHILTDPSDTVQRMAYKMLRESAAKYTEHLVLEAGVDSDAELKLELPMELVELLQMSLPESDLEVSSPQVRVMPACSNHLTDHVVARFWIPSRVDVDVRPVLQRCEWDLLFARLSCFLTSACSPSRSNQGTSTTCDEKVSSWTTSSLECSPS